MRLPLYVSLTVRAQRAPTTEPHSLFWQRVADVYFLFAGPPAGHCWMSATTESREHGTVGMRVGDWPARPAAEGSMQTTTRRGRQSRSKNKIFCRMHTPPGRSRQQARARAQGAVRSAGVVRAPPPPPQKED